MSYEVVIAKGMRLLMPNGPVLVLGIERYGIRVKTIVGEEEEVRWDELKARETDETGVQGVHLALEPWWSSLPMAVRLEALARLEVVLKILTGYRDGLADFARSGEPFHPFGDGYGVSLTVRIRRMARLREGAQRRRRGHTLTVPPRHVPNAGRYLPKRPPSPPRIEPILAGFNREDARRLQWLITQLTHQVRRHGIHPDHVPALLPMPGEDGLPDPAVWRTRWKGAIALHMLLTHVHDGPTSSARACHAFGTTDTDTSLLLDGIRLGRGIHDLDAARLTDAVDALIDAGLVDYQRRRDTRRPINHLPRLPITGARLPEINGHPGRDLAMAWMWTRLTHGPAFTGPRPFIADRHVRAFDAAIDPETRLVLAETGQQLIADADVITITTTQATWAAITRRYG